METRENAGYIIVNTVIVLDKEIVLGENAGGFYVTWEFTKDGGYNYGHYFDDKLMAMRDFLSRSIKEVEYLIEQRENRRRHLDVDADGIPDFIDGEYTSADEKYSYNRLNARQIKRLDDYDIPYEAIFQKESGDYIVRYAGQYESFVSDNIGTEIARRNEKEVIRLWKSQI